MLNLAGFLKIANFEFARICDSARPNREGHHRMIQYMAPEILIGVSEYNEKVDVWSCGCLIAELVRAAPLFAGDSPIDQFMRICSIRGKPPAGSWPEFDAAISEHPSTILDEANRLNESFEGVEVPDALLDLLNQLLALNPMDRITAEQATNHPYFDTISSVLRAQCEPLAD
jgi:serine/threonine protein kinase